jgi:hypothetical protein
MEEISKTKKVIIAIFGGIDAVVSILTPLLLALLWIKFSDVQGFNLNFFYAIGLLATLFRAYKIGWMTK